MNKKFAPESFSRTPVVALVGRPNVGKSTIFNFLTKRRGSLITDEAGTTRDRIYGKGSYQGHHFDLIDTGGVGEGHLHPWSLEIQRHTMMAVAEADLVLFVVDSTSGMLPADEEIAQKLREQVKPVVVLANKADTRSRQEDAGQFYAFGFDEVFPVSARQGLGFDDMVETLWGPSPEEEEGVRIPREKFIAKTRLAILGKPNAGKSSFINKILGSERHLISDVPGTTIDAIDSDVEYGGHHFVLIDTAGIRRKRSIGKELEKKSVTLSLNALDRAEVCLLFIDAEEGVSEQDMKIGSFIQDKGKACVVVVNKWDLVDKEKKDPQEYAQKLRDKMPFMAFAPIRFISAKTGTRVFDVLDTAREVAESYKKRVTTGEFNRFLKLAMAERQPQTSRGRAVKFYYGTQVAASPPTFVLTCNDPDLVHFSYQRFLVNRIREEFGLKGVPVRLKLVGRKKKESAK